MHRLVNPGNPRRGALLAAVMLGLGGCATHHLASNDKLGDPLLGPAAPPGQATSPLHAATPNGGGLAPIPQTSGLNTNAALAGQSTPSLAITHGDSWARKVEGTPVPSGGK